MAKEELIQFEGLVTEILPDARYRVQLDAGHEIVAYTAGKMKKNRIKTLAGDRVTIEMSPYDLEKGRLIFRHKDERPAPCRARRAVVDHNVDNFADGKLGSASRRIIGTELDGLTGWHRSSTSSCPSRRDLCASSSSSREHRASALSQVISRAQNFRVSMAPGSPLASSQKAGTRPMDFPGARSKLQSASRAFSFGA